MDISLLMLLFLIAIIIGFKLYIDKKANKNEKYEQLSIFDYDKLKLFQDNKQPEINHRNKSVVERLSRQNTVLPNEEERYNCATFDVRNRRYEKEEQINKIFNLYYYTMLETTKSFNFENNAKFELLPMIYTVCDYATVASKKSEYQRSLICNTIMEKIRSLYEDNDDTYRFANRIALYGEVINGKEVFCFFDPSNGNEYNQNQVFKCAALLCDILYNPDCANDYDNCPFCIRGLDVALNFTSSVAIPIVESVTNLFSAICDIKE